MIYLAFFPGDPPRCELRAEQPDDTQNWLGPYTPLELWARLAPNDNPLNRPEIHSKPSEHAGSYGLKPCYFHAKYDEESRSIILFDFGGYVGTVMTPENLWRAILYQSEHGTGSLRALTRVPELPGGPYLSPEEQQRINEQILEFQKKLAEKPVEKKAKQITLDDLGL